MAQSLEISALHHVSHELDFCQTIVLYILLKFCERNNHTLVLIEKGTSMLSDRCLFYS